MLILQIYKLERQYDDTWFITEMIDDVLTDILADESSPQSPARHLVLGVEAAHRHPFLVGQNWPEKIYLDRFEQKHF